MLQHILVMLCNMLWKTLIMTDGPTSWPVGTPKKTLVYAAPVGNKEALHHRIVDARQTIWNYPGIYEWMQQSTMRHVEVCTESHRGHF
jgi:hypothetical protein